MDATKLRTELGWEPKIGFAEGLAQTIEWYQEHREWWKAGKEIVEKQYAQRGQ